MFEVGCPRCCGVLCVHEGVCVVWCVAWCVWVCWCWCLVVVLCDVVWCGVVVWHVARLGARKTPLSRGSASSLFFFLSSPLLLFLLLLLLLLLLFSSSPSPSPLLLLLLLLLLLFLFLFLLSSFSLLSSLPLFLLSSLLATKHYGKNRSTNTRRPTSRHLNVIWCRASAQPVGSLPPPLPSSSLLSLLSSKK